MQLICFQKELAKALQIVGRAIPTRSTLPIIKNILLQATSGELRLTATNLDFSISCRISASVTDEGSVSVPGRALIDFVNSLPASKVEMVLSVRSQSLQVKCDEIYAQMNGIDAHEFPIVMSASEIEASTELQGETTSLYFAADGLAKRLDRVTFAASMNTAQSVLSGVHLSQQDGHWLLAATDGHRLSIVDPMVSLRDDVAANFPGLTIPAKSLNEIIRIGTDIDVNTAVKALILPSRNQLLFQLGVRFESGYRHLFGVEITAQLMESKFPDVHRAIPHEFGTVVQINTPLLLAAVRRTLIFNAGSVAVVEFEIGIDNSSNMGTVRIVSENTALGSNYEFIDAQVRGAPLAVRMNAKYLIDLLSRLPKEGETTMSLVAADQPVVFTWEGEQTASFMHLILPVVR